MSPYTLGGELWVWHILRKFHRRSATSPDRDNLTPEAVRLCRDGVVCLYPVIIQRKSSAIPVQN